MSEDLIIATRLSVLDDGTCFESIYSKDPVVFSGFISSIIHQPNYTDRPLTIRMKLETIGIHPPPNYYR